MLSGSTPSSPAGSAYLPVGVRRVIRRRAPAADGWGHARVTLAPGASGEAAGDVVLLDGEGRAVFEAHGLRLQRIKGTAGEAQHLRQHLYRLEWQPQDIAEPGPPD